MREAKPFLRWAGSKRKLLPHLMDAIPLSYDRYVEPFAGSACLFFSLKPEKAILGDVNDELMNTYRQLKKNAESVISALSKFKGDKEEYYRVRAFDSWKLSGGHRAARFIYLNRFCFNGLYRTNSRGEFNVPFGGEKSGELPTAELLQACSASLKKTTLISGSFEKTFSRIKPGDFVYMDPPYSIQARRVFNEYSNFDFGLDQLHLLRMYLKRFDRMGVSFLVSYGLSREARELAKGFNCREIVVQRQIAGFAAKRRKNRELLITNY